MTRTFRSTRSLIAGIVVVASALALCACSGGSSAPPVTDDIALVLSPTTGSTALSGNELDAALSGLDAAGDRLVAVVADGAPFVAIDVTLPALPGNSDDRDAWLTDYRSKVKSAILSKVAQATEVDPAEAIALAAQSFRPGTRRSLTVFSSGLATAGSMSMLDGRLYGEPADLVGSASGAGAVPDLTGVAVRMPRLGVVTDPQPQLTADARNSLTSIWAEYFSRSHATDVQLAASDLLAQAPQSAALPFVTPVPVNRPQPPQAAGCRQLLGAATIGFSAGSADLTDVAATTTLVTSAVESLAACAGPYTVEGSASSEGDPSSNEKISTDRAQAVAQLLADATGQPLAAIRVVGWGVNWPCRVVDLDASGNLLIDAATADRVVVIGRGDLHC